MTFPAAIALRSADLIYMNDLLATNNSKAVLESQTSRSYPIECGLVVVCGKRKRRLYGLKLSNVLNVYRKKDHTAKDCKENEKVG